MIVDGVDETTSQLVRHYAEKLRLPTNHLKVTTSRRVYEQWLGRRVGTSWGGAYCFLPASGVHAVLINTARIDRREPRALDVVVAEELLHMRDWIDGDRRRHAHHGYDRIAYRASALTGASLHVARSALIPSVPRPYRYLYRCPKCGMTVRRRRRGIWLCGNCAPRFDRRFILEIVELL